MHAANFSAHKRSPTTDNDIDLLTVLSRPLVKAAFNYFPHNVMGLCFEVLWRMLKGGVGGVGGVSNRLVKQSD